MPIRKPAQTVFGKRLRETRMRAGIAQDRLGVMIGLDESSSAARISRYETGAHEPPASVAERLAEALHVPVAYLYCPDDELAEFIRDVASLGKGDRKRLREFVDGLLAEGVRRT